MRQSCAVSSLSSVFGRRLLRAVSLRSFGNSSKSTVFGDGMYGSCTVLLLVLVLVSVSVSVSYPIYHDVAYLLLVIGIAVPAIWTNQFPLERQERIEKKGITVTASIIAVGRTDIPKTIYMWSTPITIYREIPSLPGGDITTDSVATFETSFTDFTKFFGTHGGLCRWGRCGFWCRCLRGFPCCDSTALFPVFTIATFSALCVIETMATTITVLPVIILSRTNNSTRGDIITGIRLDRGWRTCWWGFTWCPTTKNCSK